MQLSCLLSFARSMSIKGEKQPVCILLVPRKKRWLSAGVMTEVYNIVLL